MENPLESTAKSVSMARSGNALCSIRDFNKGANAGSSMYRKVLAKEGILSNRLLPWALKKSDMARLPDMVE